MLLSKYEENRDSFASIGREAIADSIRAGIPLSANDLINLFGTLSPEAKEKFLKRMVETTDTNTDAEKQKVHEFEIRRENFIRAAEWARYFSEPLIRARIEGRWSDVVEHHYHRHYTEAYLRITGILDHYKG